MPNQFEFRGGALHFLLIGIFAWFISAITLGIAFPWCYAWMTEYDINNIYLNGRQLRFNGTGFSLIGRWLKWLFFIIITLGIYAFWIYPDLQKWKWENTDFQS